LKSRAGGENFDDFDGLPCRPPPSLQNASWRWRFRLFPRPPRRPSPLLRITSGSFRSYPRPATSFTSLASNCELEVGFRSFPRPSMSPTSLASKRELEVEISTFLTACHIVHLPRLETRAGGGDFDIFHCLPRRPPPSLQIASWRWVFEVFHGLPCHPPPSLRNASWRWRFRCFPRPTMSPTSFASKCELEVPPLFALHPPRTQERAGGSFYSNSTCSHRLYLPCKGFFQSFLCHLHLHWHWHYLTYVMLCILTFLYLFFQYILVCDHHLLSVFESK
jgi:hypothetical protein